MGTTHMEYLYCTAKVVHLIDICKMFNINYYGVFLIRWIIACRTHTSPLTTFFQKGFMAYYPKVPSSPSSVPWRVQLYTRAPLMVMSTSSMVSMPVSVTAAVL